MLSPELASIKELLSPISAAVGGVLTIVGGFLSSALIQQSGRRTENRRFLRDKLEELYQLCQALDEWRIYEMQLTAAKEGDTLEMKECSIDRIVMIVRLYFPSLVAETDALKKLVNSYNNALFAFYMEVRENHSKSRAEHFDELLHRPIDDLEAGCNALLTQVEHEARRGF